MRKIKILSAAMCCVMFLTACSASGQSSQSGGLSDESSSVASSEVCSEPAISSEPTSRQEETLCKAYALYCVEDDLMIDSYNKDKVIAPASLTKVLTASVTLRYLKADEVITVGSELDLVNKGSSLCMISKGQRLTVYDLMTGLLLPSGNDAAYTAAVCTARKVCEDPEMPDKQAVEFFCKMMNEMARELGMKNTHFADPDGWDDPAHYTTAADLVKAAKYALTVPEIREIVATPKKYVVFESGESITWYNGNKLLHPEGKYYRENVIGMKNGLTDEAGWCLIAAFVKNEKTYIAVVAGSEEDEDRYNKTLQLIDMA